MSINWVMLHPTTGFVRLPNEKPVYKSSPRTSLSITTPQSYPGNNPLAINSSSGTVYLTNQRIVYLPLAPTPSLQSFSAPLLNLHDSHITVPWFGPNAWQAAVQPVPGGNIPPGHLAIELKLTFKEGGVTDFHSNFERIKERLGQAVEVARESGAAAGGSNLSRVNMEAVHLDQLPSYEASRQDRVAPIGTQEPVIERPPAVDDGMLLDVSESEQEVREVAEQNPRIQESSTGSEPPTEAPPGYEETQQQSLQQEVERRLMQ